jgi:hypothetical protein
MKKFSFWIMYVDKFIIRKAGNMTKEEFKAFRKSLIKSHLKSPRTANQVIERIFVNDLSKGATFVISSRGWKFYVHLNKLFSAMEKSGEIQNIGVRDGEKLWLTCEPRVK